MPWATSRAGRLARRFAAPAIWASWRALEALLGLQFGLKKAGLRPGGRIKDSIQCATSVETPGFYKAVRAGRIRAVKGNVSGCARRHTGGWPPPPADVVVLAIGWRRTCRSSTRTRGPS